MTTPRKDTRLARKRANNALEREGAKAVSLTYVMPDIATVLGQIQSVAGTEIERMARAQQTDPDSRLNLDEVKKLSALTTAVSEAHKTSKSLRDDDLQGMSLEDLKELLRDEIATETAQAEKAAGNA